MSSMLRLCSALGLLLLGSACETNLINNPSFDRWCGKDLCDWTTEAGKVERVGSWHDKDYAVSFTETPTRISQLSTATWSGCIRFDMLADVDPRAQLTLLVDFDDDGADVLRQAVTGRDFETASFSIPAPGRFSKVRYTFAKLGMGRAVLAQVWAELEDGCTGSSEAME